ncbi:uncharacterized protein [Montipora capricornis]|uniref:uncharacterized protein n=1 Tax=Montipora capricornis TaxID=246305 RepID=UPI0035F1B690
MDQLVSRVTEEVTKRLQPLLSNLGSLAQQAQSPPPPHHCKHLPCHSLWNSPLFCSLLDPTSNKPKGMLPSKIQSRYLLFTMASSQSSPVFRPHLYQLISVLGSFSISFLYLFFIILFEHLPISPSILAFFIAYLFRSQYAPSTVVTYVSCLGYCHKLKGFSDPSKVFYVAEMLKGFNKVGFRLDSRLPITLPILDKLISVSPSLVGSPYQICQFQAMCSLAFFAFLRIGEMTSTSGRSDTSPLQISHISKLLSSSRDLIAFKITFGNFKHSYNFPPFSILVSGQPQSCPVELLAKYLACKDPDRVLSSLQWMGLQFLDLIFPISCHLSYSFVVCPPQFTRGTVFELVLLLMLQMRGYPMLKSAS